jgi:3-hydroxyanthranilate 3,4-dioxygenase
MLKDYHYNETEELFYQLEGSISNHSRRRYPQRDGTQRWRYVSASSKVPHSPVRSEGSIGLVIERKRAAQGYVDGLLWFCDNCNHKLHEVYFELNNIEKISCLILSISTIQSTYALVIPVAL